MIGWSVAACVMVVDFPGRTPGDLGPTTSGTVPGDSGTRPGGAAPSIVGDAPGDRLGELGVWAVPDRDGDGDGTVVVGVDGAVGLFDAGELGPETPFSSARATWVTTGAGGAFADLGAAYAIGSSDSARVWIVAADAPGGDPAAAATGRVDPHAADGADTALGTSLAAGDWDGDGIVDLVIGDPLSGDDGRVFVADGAALSVVSADLLEVRVRGDVAGFGTAVALGELDGTGEATLVGCSSDGDGDCSLLVGGAPMSDADVDEIRFALVNGTATEPLAQEPRIADVDGDGALDLVVPGAASVGVWFGPVAGGVRGLADADLHVTGVPVGEVAADRTGALLIGAPAGAGAVFRIGVSGALPGDGIREWSGAGGDELGWSLSEVGALGGPDSIAVAAPGSDTSGADAGQVWILPVF